MVESYKAVDIDTDQVIEVVDVEPIPAALRFKKISDRIWSEKPADLMGAWHSIPSQITPREARDAINEVVSEIDERLVISGMGKALDFGRVHGEGYPVIVSAEVMDQPMAASVETFNWDARNTHRAVEIEGERKVVEFADGHVDFYRELSAKLAISRGVMVTYSMQRIQTHQDQPISIALIASHFDFAETGYEGHHLANEDITEEQEMRMLDVIERMGGFEQDK